ncbi:MAG: Ig-like domain-containing protein, partial [Spirochaeta sp.]
MSKVTRQSLALVVMAVFAIGITACENVFQIGMGERVDLGPPSIAVRSHEAGAFLSGTEELSGVASDDGGIASVEVNLNQQDPDSWVKADFDPGQQLWTYTVDTTRHADGPLYLTVRATDTAGKISLTDDILLRVDNYAPVVLVTDPRGVAQAAPFNSQMRLSITSYDRHDIDHFGLRVRDADGNILPRRALSGEDLPNPIVVQESSPWNFTFRSHEFYPDLNDPAMDFYFEIWAEDAAGHRSRQFFQIDDVTNPDLYLSGETTVATAAEIAHILRTNPAPPDGEEPLRQRLLEKSYSQELPWSVAFDEDSDVPVIGITRPDISGAGSYYLEQGSPINFYVEDDDFIAAGYPKIKVWSDADLQDYEGPGEYHETLEWETLYNERFSRRSFSYELEEGAVGTWWLLIAAEDEGPEPAVSRREIGPVSFTFTSGVPVVGFDDTPAPGSFHAGNLVLSGYASHEIAVDRVEISLDGGNSYELVEAHDEIAETWSHTINTAGYANGSHTIYVKAFSGSGADVTQSRTLNFDNTAPSLEIIAPETGQSVNQKFLLRGTADDNLQVAQVEYQVVAKQEIDPTPIADYEPTGSWTTFTDGDGNNLLYSWSTLLDSASLDDGQEYVLYTRVTDRAGNQSREYRQITVDQDSDRPTVELTDLDASITASGEAGGAENPKNLLELNARIRGTIEDDDGVDPDSIRISLNSDADYGAVDQKGSSGQRVSFSHNVAELGDGEHFFYLQFSDDAAVKPGEAAAVETTVGPIYFLIDTAAPAISITEPSSGEMFSSGFSIKGTASDANGLDKVEHRRNDAINWTVLSVTDGNWEIPVAVDTDGGYQYEIRATDAVGKQSSVVFDYTIDTEPPTLADINLSENDLVNQASYTVSGTASDVDGSGVALVEYRVHDGAAWGSWADANGTTSWTALLEGLTEGLGQTIELRVTDRAGNSLTESIGFHVDTGAPTISGLNLGTGTEYRNADFDIEFTLEDTLGLANYTVTRNGTALAGHDGSAASGTSQAITVNEDVGGLSDGSYEYEIIVTDDVGKTAGAVRTVVVDTASPDVTISSPSTD